MSTSRKITRELRAYAENLGFSVDISPGGKHGRIRLRRGSLEAALPFSAGSNTDERGLVKQMKQQIRRIARQPAEKED